MSKRDFYRYRNRQLDRLGSDDTSRAWPLWLRLLVVTGFALFILKVAGVI